MFWRRSRHPDYFERWNRISTFLSLLCRKLEPGRIKKFSLVFWRVVWCIVQGLYFLKTTRVRILWSWIFQRRKTLTFFFFQLSVFEAQECSNFLNELTIMSRKAIFWSHCGTVSMGKGKMKIWHQTRQGIQIFSCLFDPLKMLIVKGSKSKLPSESVDFGPLKGTVLAGTLPRHKHIWIKNPQTPAVWLVWRDQLNEG